MVRVFESEEGLACIKRFNRETEIMSDVVISSEPFSGIFWESKDGSTVATVHPTCINVFSIPSLQEIYSVSVSSAVIHGCINVDGQFLAYREGDQYHTHNIVSRSLIASFVCADGLTCWVNSEAVFIKKRDDCDRNVMRMVRHSENTSIDVPGSFAVEDDGRMYVLDTSGSDGFIKLGRHNDLTVEVYKTGQDMFIAACDVSPHFLLVSDGERLLLFDRMERRLCFERETECVQFVHITPDEKSFSVGMQTGVAEVFNAAGECLTIIPAFYS
ncbi:hypothetical protein PCE1_003738 [Barthelona sp. PCE]